MDRQSSSVPIEHHQVKPAQEYIIQNHGGEYIEAPIQYDPIYYEQNGSTLVYQHDYQSMPQEIYHEEIVGQEEYVESLPSTSTAPPPPTNKQRLIKDPHFPYPNSTVLMTSQSLKADNATLMAKAGKRPTQKDSEEKKPSVVNENGSLLNRRLPGMSTIFKVLRESALKKTQENLKSDVVEEEEELESKIVHHEEPEDLHDQIPPPMERLGGDERMFDQWPLYSNRPIDFKEACELLIGVQQIDYDKVCKTLPLQFKHEGTFLIDTTGNEDVYSDQNGRWEIPSGKVRFYKEIEDGNLIRVDDGKGQLKEWTKDYTFKIMLKRYDNQVTRDADDGRGQFQKKIYTGYKDNESLTIAIVTYSWNNGRPWNFVPPVPLLPVRKRRTNWEKKSYEKVNMTSMPQMMSSYYEGFNIYSHCIINFDDAVAILLGATLVDPNKVCSSVPVGYRQNGTFVIDLRRMGHCLLELRRDDNGLWGKPSGFSRFYKFAENGDAMRVDKAGKMLPGGDYDVKIYVKRYEHMQVDKKFVRKIYTVKGKNSDSFPGSPEYAIILYYWKGDPIQFEPNFKQSMVRTEDKDYAKFQQIADEEQDYVETSGAMEQEVIHDVEIEEKNMPPPQLKRARFSTEPENLIEMKMALIRREMENQDRFSAVLDRADAMLNRMEQRFGMEPVYAETDNVVPHWEQVEDGDLIQEEVIDHY